MKERIAAETHENIDASTFHKLGLNIISRAEGKKPNISEMPMLAFIKDQINRLVEDNNYLKMLNQYAIIGYNKTKDSFEFGTEYEYEQYLKENPPITLLGETVKSYGEMEIANFLFQNGITYEYEKPYKIDTRTEQYSQYKPDFYLPEYDIYIKKIDSLVYQLYGLTEEEIAIIEKK